MCLFDYARWFDIINIQPKSKRAIYFIYGEQFIRKRTTPHLISYYQPNLKQQPEAYYYCLLLLFMPWLNENELKRDEDSYEKTFAKCSENLAESMKYHDQFEKIKKAREAIHQEVERLEKNEEINEDKNDTFNVLGFEEKAFDDLKEMNNLVQQDKSITIEEEIARLNVDQKRIFDEVITKIQIYCTEFNSANSSKNLDNARLVPKEVTRKFVSGVGGTGKSFLINILRKYITQKLNKEVAVAAPTGIAAFNVNGITIHRLFKLPVEIDDIPTYKPLSDLELHTIRQELKDTVLLIIDEISMVSNITLTYIHLRLSDIFNTIDENDGWFGRMNILLFGDLLQLTPVNGDPPYLDIPAPKISKYLSCLTMPNLWQNLFTYDELTINVRQKSDKIYATILNNVRLGILSAKDYEILAKRQLQLNSHTTETCLNDLVEKISSLPENTVCILSKNAQCETINNAMLSKIDSALITLKAVDDIEAKTNAQKLRALKSLAKFADESNKTAGLENEVKIKIGVKIMLLRNIEVASGLVNGAIGRIIKIHTSPDKTKQNTMDGTYIQRLTIKFEIGEREIEPVQSKFPLHKNVYVVREQFPIRLAYAITIHKSQGVTVQNAVVDIGDNMFCSGQVYVALSRVTNLNGLHIINVNPASVKAEKSAIIEYNRLRNKYRPDLAPIVEYLFENEKMNDTNIFSRKKIIQSIDANMFDAKNSKRNDAQTNLLNTMHGFINTSNCCWANATLQCILNINAFQQSIRLGPSNVLKNIFLQYNNPLAGALDLLTLRREFARQFSMGNQHDATEFILTLVERYPVLKSKCQFDYTFYGKCARDCVSSRTKNVQRGSSIYFLHLPPNRSLNMQALIDFNFNTWTTIVGSTCSNRECSQLKSQTRQIENPKEVLIFQLQLSTNIANQKITNLELKSVPQTELNIHNKRYVLAGAIFHHGRFLVHNSNHYTAIVRKGNSFFEANDTFISRRNWPRNSKDLFVLFYVEKTNN